MAALTPHHGRNDGARIAAIIGFGAGGTGSKFGGCLAALTMIKKALPCRFPLMCQADRMTEQLVCGVWTILWGIPGAL
jgi:hypothetical protein